MISIILNKERKVPMNENYLQTVWVSSSEKRVIDKKWRLFPKTDIWLGGVWRALYHAPPSILTRVHNQNFTPLCSVFNETAILQR